MGHSGSTGERFPAAFDVLRNLHCTFEDHLPGGASGWVRDERRKSADGELSPVNRMEQVGEEIASVAGRIPRTICTSSCLNGRRAS